MSDCEFLEKCPIFAKFCSEGLKNVWIRGYCKKDPEKCERKKIRLSGQMPPPAMLPNGSLLKSLE